MSERKHNVKRASLSMCTLFVCSLSLGDSSFRKDSTNRTTSRALLSFSICTVQSHTHCTHFWNQLPDTHEYLDATAIFLFLFSLYIARSRFLLLIPSMLLISNVSSHFMLGKTLTKRVKLFFSLLKIERRVKLFITILQTADHQHSLSLFSPSTGSFCSCFLRHNRLTGFTHLSFCSVP